MPAIKAEAKGGKSGLAKKKAGKDSICSDKKTYGDYWIYLADSCALVGIKKVGIKEVTSFFQRG